MEEDRPPVPGFQPASVLPRPTHLPSTSSHRNATNALPPVPAPASETPKEPAKEDAPPVAGPSKPVQRPTARKNAIVYNAVQRRNPVRQSVKNVGMEIGDIAADFQVGTHNGVLFLSLKYHRLHPEYIHQRIEKMKNQYKLRIILVLCDINEHQQSLREITKIAIVNEFTVFVAWSNEEVAQYLVSFKQQETTSANILKEKIHQTYHNQLSHALTSGKKVNKTDADNLASQFGSFHAIARQPSKVLAGVKGLGATKVNSLLDAFNKPFMIGGLKRADGIARPATDLAASKSMSTADRIAKEAGHDAPANGTGQLEVNAREDDEQPERVESPDWPSDDDEDGDERDRTVGRGREKVPSRSPPPPAGDGAVWQDPLDDDGEDGDEAAETESQPPTKRIRSD